MTRYLFKVSFCFLCIKVFKYTALVTCAPVRTQHLLTLNSRTCTQQTRHMILFTSWINFRLPRHTHTSCQKHAHTPNSQDESRVPSRPSRVLSLQDPKPWPKPWPQAWPWWCALVGLALAQGSTKAHQGLAQGTAKAWWCLGDETSFKKAGISNEIAILISSKVCNPDYTILITQLLANNERTQHFNAGSPASRWRSGTRGGRRPSARRR